MTAEQRAVVAMVVLDPDAWIANAINVFGVEKAEENLALKVAKYQAQYDVAVASGTYKTKAQVQADYEASPEYLAEKEKMAAITLANQKKMQAIIDNLPSWSVVGGKFNSMLAGANAATNLAQAKAVLIELINVQKKMARVLYWEVKGTEE
jgi:hypothetical protein